VLAARLATSTRRPGSCTGARASGTPAGRFTGGTSPAVASQAYRSGGIRPLHRRPLGGARGLNSIRRRPSGPLKTLARRVTRSWDCRLNCAAPTKIRWPSWPRRCRGKGRRVERLDAHGLGAFKRAGRRADRWCFDHHRRRTPGPARPGRFAAVGCSPRHQPSGAAAAPGLPITWTDPAFTGEPSYLESAPLGPIVALSRWSTRRSLTALALKPGGIVHLLRRPSGWRTTDLLRS
jgi:hypothetical protein